MCNRLCINVSQSYIIPLSWWRNQMETFFVLLALCVGNHTPAKVSDAHDDVIKWKHFPRNWPFVRGIHRSPVNSPHKGQWRGALMYSLICVWINDWVNNREAGDLRPNRAHYDVTVMDLWCFLQSTPNKRLSKQSRRPWFETPSRSLWRHYNGSNPLLPQ